MAGRVGKRAAVPLGFDPVHGPWHSTARRRRKLDSMLIISIQSNWPRHAITTGGYDGIRHAILPLRRPRAEIRRAIFRRVPAADRLRRPLRLGPCAHRRALFPSLWRLLPESHRL